MKVAMWTLGVFVLGLLGVVLVNLFGNITVTNQLNYTTMKNAVEAAMYDALDKEHYQVGFCLCTTSNSSDGKWSFLNDGDYQLSDIIFNGNEEKCPNESKCRALHGEYRIKPKVFSESLIRRVAEMVNNNKDYEIIIQDIIEYPPKVSVKIVSKDKEFTPTEKNSGGYTIVNQLDAIIETSGGKMGVVVTTPTSSPTPVPTSTTTPKEYACYYIDKDPYDHIWVEKGKQPVGYSLETKIKEETDCKNVCYCSADACGVYANGKTWAGWTEYPNATYNSATKSCGMCYYDGKGTYQYQWVGPDGTAPSGYTKESSTKQADCINVCYCNSDNSACGMYAKGKEKEWPGWTQQKDASGNLITDSNQCKVTSTSTTPASPEPTSTTTGYDSNYGCDYWHASMYFVTYESTDSYGVETARTKSCPKKSPSEESSQSGIVASYRSAFETHALTCFSAKETIDGILYVNKFVGTDIMGYQYFNVFKKGTYTLLCSKQEATSPTGAISSCSKCGSNDCVAICTK